MTLIRYSVGAMFVACAALAVPLMAFAQSPTFGDDFGDYGTAIIELINNTLVPLVFAFALLFFIYGVFLYFIKGGSEDDARSKGRQYILWAIIALVVMVSVWGLTNLIARGLGFEQNSLDGSLIPNAPGASSGGSVDMRNAPGGAQS